MELFSIHDLKLLMLIGTFLLGVITFLLGLGILVYGAWGRDLRGVAAQTARLAQKGLAEEISGLVGNASTLLISINEMMRTSTGIGFYLTIVGAILMIVACWVILRIT